jgi:hypothetical protein
MQPPPLQSEFSDRLVALHDGRPGLRGALHITASPPDADPSINNQPSAINSSVLDFISSDDTLDRYHEIIAPSGWQLTSYKRNPVFQNSHQYGDIIFTIGKALITEIRPGGTSSASPHLFQRILFATAANPAARIAYALYSGKFLNAVSVGFIPIRWENGTAESGFSRKYLEQELLEVSAVAIPANPNALALAYKSGAIEKSDLKETADLINYTLANPAPSGPPPVPQELGSEQERPPLKSPIIPIPPTPAPGLLRLARSLRDLLVL